MRRFLAFALPLLVLTMALFQLILEALGQGVSLGRLSEGVVSALPGWVILGSWCLEALGLCCIYLLVGTGGSGPYWNGLMAGWIAWIFRGPLLVISVATLAGLPPGPWWSLTFRWWLLYTLCGLLLGLAARVADLSPAPAPAAAAPPAPVIPIVPVAPAAPEPPRPPQPDDVPEPPA